MRVKIDGILELDEQNLTIGSWWRDSSERAVAGLDGVLSVDLGKRSREIVQNGILRAVSEKALESEIKSVVSLMDGGTHTFLLDNGQELENLRIDAVETDGQAHSGGGVHCKLQIRYTQLAD